MNALLVLLVLAGLLVLYAIITYNRFNRDRNTIDEAWSGIDVQLERRHKLIRILMETVRGHTGHEAGILAGVTAQRGGGIARVSDRENRISGALVELFAVAQAYPELRASENFTALQHDLGNIEDHIQLARRCFNSAVRVYNAGVESFPGNLLAAHFGFARRELFEPDTATGRRPARALDSIAPDAQSPPLPSSA